MIDKNSPLPIYYQLEEEIRNLIKTKQLTPGQLLPSEREYAERHNISRMTVRQAINNLAAEGLLVRQKGKGTFVSDKKFEQTLQGVTSFSEDMRARGLEPSNKLLDFSEQPADEVIAGKLGIEKGDPIYWINRVRLADGAPVAIEAIYTPKKVVGTMQEDQVASSFYEYIENTLQLKINHSEQTIEAAIANNNQVDYLHLEQGDPVLVIERLTYLQTGVPLEYVHSAYRADKYKFRLQMPR